MVGKPTTIEECRILAAWVEAQPPHREVLATADDILRHIEFMAATLPSKRVDLGTGKDRTAVYVRVLMGRSKAALAHMSSEAFKRFEWFPVPAQCLALADEYRPPVDDRAAVLRLCEDTANDLFERWLANVGQGQPIGDVPDRWLRIAVERGTLRRLEHDRYVTRALYHHLPIRRG